MNELEVRMRVHALIKDMVGGFMTANGVSATMMVDALNAMLVDLYPMVQSEMLQAKDESEAQQQQQAQAAQVQTEEPKATPKKKEDK